MHPHERTHTNTPTRIRLVLSQVRGHSWKTASAEQAAPLVEHAPPPPASLGPTSSPRADPTLLAEAVALPAFWEALVKGLLGEHRQGLRGVAKSRLKPLHWNYVWFQKTPHEVVYPSVSGKPAAGLPPLSITHC